MTRIAIVTHEIDRFEGSSYLLNRMCELWRTQGIEIAVVKGVSQPLPAADLAILHTDITVVSDDYQKILKHYPKVINGHALDISKKAFSDLIVSEDDTFRGPVIVKTNANYGGMRERVQKLHGGDQRGNINIQRPWRRVEWLEHYPVFHSTVEVPRGVWRNDRLVVEKFLPEKNPKGEYLVRIWVFFGDKEIYYQCVSEEPVIKSHNTLRREFLKPDDIPKALRETRARLGFDFGKFDFAVAGDQTVLYDINRTPGSPRQAGKGTEVSETIAKLSTGLEYFIHYRLH